jgi:8-oxo-dGTP pyrophosphatase MutT (NUDIX family)
MPLDLDLHLFPALCQATSLGIPSLQCRFVRSDMPPPGHLISNVNIVPWSAAEWVILRLQNDRWEIPGGTLEPGEDYETALRRELREEAGARLVSVYPLGAWQCRSSAPQPYRPHLPHPESCRYVVCGEISIEAHPANPESGEQVITAIGMSLEEAVHRFQTAGRPELAELYRLAAAVRILTRDGS